MIAKMIEEDMLEKLEKLYTAAMNFDYTKKLCNDVISEIEEIFSIKAKGE